MSNKPYRRGAHALIFDADHKILLIQHQNYQDNQWNFPGGGREQAESALDNALREASEELGFTNNDLQLLAVSSHANIYDFPQSMIDSGATIAQAYRGQHKDHVMFRFIGDKQSINVDPREIRQYQWVALDELDKYLVFPHQYQEVQPVVEEYYSLAV